MPVKELNVLKWKKKKNVGTYQNVTTPLFSIVVSFYFLTYQDQHLTITKELWQFIVPIEQLKE